MASSQLPTDHDWKNPNFVTSWKATRRKRLEQVWAERWAPLVDGPLAASRDFELQASLADAADQVQDESESLTERARRLERAPTKKTRGRVCQYRVPFLIGKDDAGEFVFSPLADRARLSKLHKSADMFDGELEKKAQRELACGLLGGEVTCTNGHRFSVAYECGNRYCETCGPKQAGKLFARHREKLFAVAGRLLRARGPGHDAATCDICRVAADRNQLPHWPPAKGSRPPVVVAKLDFTLINTGHAGPELMRHLNLCIKRFCRAFERRFGISRKHYGLAYCDELGENNTNAHAHGIYVGPWLPQERRELSTLWEKVTKGSGGPIGLIVSIKYAYSFDAAFYHAVKYPAKYAGTRSTPGRLAELEIVFHRVRRFHTIGAFYNPDVPEPEKPAGRCCPQCGEKLSEVHKWRLLVELDGRGLRDVVDVTRELAKSKILSGTSPPGLPA